LLRPEIDFVLDEVEGFEFKNSRLRMSSGKIYDYDYLVVSTGCIPSPERIPGLKEAGDHFYQHDPARELYKENLDDRERPYIYRRNVSANAKRSSSMWHCTDGNHLDAG